jgi:hypothetical protein
VIPTGYKMKLPKTLSYPLGTKAISDALVDVPQAAILSVSFTNYARRLHGTETPYPVLAVSYDGRRPHTFSSNDFIKRGFYDPKWTIDVEAVPRHLKHLVQTKVCEEGFPRLKAWLLANHHSLKREGHHKLTILFDELAAELSFEEFASTDWQTIRR